MAVNAVLRSPASPAGLSQNPQSLYLKSPELLEKAVGMGYLFCVLGPHEGYWQVSLLVMVYSGSRCLETLRNRPIRGSCY